MTHQHAQIPFRDAEGLKVGQLLVQTNTRPDPTRIFWGLDMSENVAPAKGSYDSGDQATPATALRGLAQLLRDEAVNPGKSPYFPLEARDWALENLDALNSGIASLDARAQTLSMGR